ncbi:MAG: amidohydrolase family protein, partial [Alphaproteobacteria bacterium]|nr:amidohydrolase family protein [Alphaproteobacteria bacterium]
MTEMLLTNLALLDVEAGRLRTGLQVLVRDERIVAVEPGIAGAAKAERIDLGGRTLMPGLIDCHVHVCADAMTGYPQIFPSMVAAKAAKIMREMLRRGFTSVRDAAGADLGYKQAVEAGLFEGPRLFIAGRPIGQTGGHADWRNQADPCAACACTEASTLRWTADGVDQVRRAVREELRRGADQIKIMASGGISSPSDPIDYVQYSMDELLAAVDEARRAHRYVMAHAYTAEAIGRAVEAGIRTIEHGNMIDEIAAAAMAARGAYLVPTLVTYRKGAELAAKLGHSALHNAKRDEVLAVGTRSLDIARRAGVKMAYGTDLFRTPNDYQAEEFLIRAEVLPPAEIIRSATAIGAEVLC